MTTFNFKEHPMKTTITISALMLSVAMLAGCNKNDHMGPAQEAGAAVDNAGAKVAERHNAPKPLNLSSNQSISPAGASPTASEFSQTPASPGAMANGSPPSNVHRIQLDFKPSMEDEISLRAGQLVRLLHEYDDGWVSILHI